MKGTAISARQQAASAARHETRTGQAQRGDPATDALLALQRSAGNAATSELLRGVVEAPAQPLEPALLRDMEARFGADFSDVRVHLDARAGESATALDARAYAVGRHVIFGAGQYAPQSGEGRRLLAHELAHVVQQRQGGAVPSLDAGAPHEMAAGRAAAQAVSGSGPVAVGGGTGIGVARAPLPKGDAADAARQRIAKAQAELDTLQAAAERNGNTLTQNDTVRAYDAINSPLRQAGASKDKSLQQAAGGLSARFTAIVQGSPAARQADPFAQHPAASTTPMTPEEANRTNLTQRGFAVGVPAGARADELAAADARAAPLMKDPVKNKQAIDKAYQRVAISAPTLRQTDGLGEATAELRKQHDAASDPAEKARLGRLIQANEQKIAAPVGAGELRGGPLGHRARTFVTVQIIDRHGEIITLRAENKGSGKGAPHAEDVIMQQLQALPDKNRLVGARMTIFGDQEVCERCARRLPAFARENGLKKIVGVTEHVPKLTSAGKLAGGNATAKNTVKKVADPAEVAKLEAAQAAAGQIQPGDKVKLAYQTMKIWPPQGEAAASAKDAGHDHGPGKPGPGEHAPGAPVAATKAPGGAAAPARKAKQVKPPKAATKSSPPAQQGSQAKPAEPPPAPQPRKRAAKPDASDAPAPVPRAAKPPAARKAGRKPAPSPANVTPANAPPTPAPVPPAPVSKIANAVPPRALAPNTIAPSAAKPQANAPHPAPQVPRAKAAPPGPAASKVAVKGQAGPPGGVPKSAAPGPGGKGVPPPAAGVTAAGGNQAGLARGGKLLGGQGFGGAQGTLGAQAEQSHGRGIKTSQSAFVGGKVVTSAEEVANTHPAQMRVHLTISLDAGLGAGASREGDVGGSLAVGASGSLTISVAHVLPAEDAQRYLAAAQGGSGGAQRELQVVQLMAVGSVHEARQILAEMKAAAGAASAAKQARPGDEFSVSAEGQVNAEAGVSAKGGGLGAGANFGVSRGGGIERSQSFDDKGNLVITVSIHDDTGMKAGITGSFEAAGGGYEASQSGSRSSAISFVLNPNDPAKDAHIDEIYAVTTLDGLRALAQRRPELAGSVTTGHSRAKSNTVSASLLGAGLSVTEGSEYGEQRTRDASGETRSYTGAGSGGAEASLGGHTLAKFSQTDRFTGTVGPDGKATGESSSAASETDYGRSVVNLVGGASEHPLGTAAGLASGNTKVLQDSTDVQGVKLNDDSYTRLANLAENPAAWQRSWNGSVGTFIDWEATRRKVLAANGDRDRIAKALATFESQGSGRSRTLENAVGDSGVGFEFPAGLGEQKQVYDALVAGDPVGEARALAEQGKAADAIAMLNDDSAQLGRLMRAITLHGDDFKNAARMNEMMSRISTRATVLRGEMRRLSPAPAPAPKAPTARPAIGPPTEAQATEQAEAERAAREQAEQKRAERNARIEFLVPACLSAADKERQIFRQVDEEENSFFGSSATDIIGLLNQDRSAWPAWDAMVQELRQIYQERGESPDRANQFAPRKGEWQRRNDHVLKS